MGFYYVPGNLESHNRSAVNHIQLVMLAMEADLNKVGQRMFRRVVDDLRSLETVGISIGEHKFRVIVQAITGDNLGSHWLGGFVTNFSSASHMCRYCSKTRLEFNQGCVSATLGHWRTVDSYNNALQKLTTENCVMFEGVKYDSTFYIKQINRFAMGK